MTPTSASTYDNNNLLIHLHLHLFPSPKLHVILHLIPVQYHLLHLLCYRDHSIPKECIRTSQTLRRKIGYTLFNNYLQLTYSAHLLTTKHITVFFFKSFLHGILQLHAVRHSSPEDSLHPTPTCTSNSFLHHPVDPWNSFPSLPPTDRQIWWQWPL